MRTITSQTQMLCVSIKKKMKKILLAILIFCTSTTFGQDTKKIEKDLLKHLKKINYWAESVDKGGSVSPTDSLDKENDIFQRKLLSYTAKQPATLTYDFKELQKEHLTIASSADKKFRIYSWDTWLGGTMHNFENVYQFQTGNKVSSKSLSEKRQDGEPESWFSDIFTLGINSRKIYIGYFHAIYSSSSVYQGIKLFDLTNNRLNDEVRLIKTKTGLKNELGFEFDFFSVVDRKERPVKLIYFDNSTKTIKIPVVTSKRKVTNKFLTYKFTGQFFEKQ